jgi:hypothetical protein
VGGKDQRLRPIIRPKNQLIVTSRRSDRSSSTFAAPITTAVSGSSASVTGSPVSFAKQNVEVAQQRATACQHYSLVHDVRGKLRGSALERDSHRFGADPKGRHSGIASVTRYSGQIRSTSRSAISPTRINSHFSGGIMLSFHSASIQIARLPSYTGNAAC